MKNFKIVPTSYRYNLYQRKYLFFWVLITAHETLAFCEDTITHLKQKAIYA